MTARKPVVVALTAAQVDHVVRAAGGRGELAVMLAGLYKLEGILAAQPEILASARMSRSLLMGLRILANLGGEPASVTDLAEQLALSPSTAHRYLITLVAAGLVEQDTRSRRYRRIELPPHAGEAT